VLCNTELLHRRKLAESSLRILYGTQVFNSGLLDMPLATMFGDMKAVIDVATIGNYCSASLALKQAAATRQST
jgi:hypothetical protein